MEGQKEERQEGRKEATKAGGKDGGFAFITFIHEFIPVCVIEAVIMLLVTVAAANSSEEVKTRSGIVGAHLSVAFVGDPLDLNLFPPHVSGVAAGGARGEWQRQRSRMAVVVFISSPKQSALCGSSAAVTPLV